MPLHRVVYDAKGELDVTAAVVVRAEGEVPAGDPAVDSVFALFGEVYDFWRLCHFRDSVDDAGASLIAVVHVGEGYANADWDGDHAYIGDGGGAFHSFATNASLIYFLGARGVLDHLPLDDTTVEAAALRRGCANVFACLTEQFTLRQSAAAGSWLVGQGLLRPEAGGGALYSLAAPGTASPYDPQIAMVGPSDDEAVLAGVPAHAFYRFARALGGYAWETAGRVWYATLTDERAGPAWQSFAGFAALTVQVAGELYGGAVADHGAAAWSAVGVTW
ncbi:M4 family metallopeptidase [Nonomuraea sp. ZG12]|uniref:M4 family metallopeptidase n=1 Tax=Nonomuraea sp. ZG12 TaxID=3452207 RepID=UPI003F8891F2